MQDIPELSDICISTYNKDDVKSCRKLLQDTDDLKIRESGGFGISKVHKIFIPKEDNGVLYWKKDSFDNDYAEAQIIESKMQKRFKAKRQNKDDVLQEDIESLHEIPQFLLISWYGNFVERRSFNTRKLGKYMVFYSVSMIRKAQQTMRLKRKKLEVQAVSFSSVLLKT